MKKIKFVPDYFNLKKLAEYLQLSLIIVGSTQLSPNVIKYWERYCKAQWDARYAFQYKTINDKSFTVKYAGTLLQANINMVSYGKGPERVSTKIKIILC